MSGHNLIEHLRQTEHSYTEGLIANIITVESGAPDGNTEGYLYIRTDGTDEDARLYVRGNTTLDDWDSVPSAS